MDRKEIIGTRKGEVGTNTKEKAWWNRSGGVRQGRDKGNKGAKGTETCR